MEKPHKKLDVWQKSMQLVVDVYEAAGKFPKVEGYALTEQVRRSVVSIPSNIAEGAARRSRKEFIQHLSVAQGSLSELDTQMELGNRLGWVTEETSKLVNEQMQQVDKMLCGLLQYHKGKLQHEIRKKRKSENE